MTGASYSKQAPVNFLVSVVLKFKKCKIHDIWFNPVLKILLRFAKNSITITKTFIITLYYENYQNDRE